MTGSAAVPIAAITLVPGTSDGPAFVLQEPLSFWGGLDATTGEITDRWHPQSRAILARHVLVMESGRGSSSGSSVLAEAIRRGTGPAGIVMLTRDAIVTVGAMIAVELYDVSCPVVLVAAADWPTLVAAQRLTLDAGSQRATLTVQ